MGHIEQFYRFLGFNVFIFDYRGYGGSTGTPDEEGLLCDARTAMNFIEDNPQIDSKRILIYGRSLGGAVGIYAATHFRDLWGLIIENTFTSITEVVKDKYILGQIYARLLSDEWNSHARVESIECPILFISGRKDKMVPPEHMDELY